MKTPTRSAEVFLTEKAWAKVNLSLRILGRRMDGYHELESIVAFADTSDVVRMEPGPAFSLEIDGPFGAVLDNENLITKAVRLATEAADGTLTSGHFTLTKNLPVAAGLGGGSADAAAVLRLLKRANPHLAKTLDWQHLALRLGADVPVCLNSCAALMTGLGEQLSPIAQLPPAAILVANPRVPLATADVFRTLAAPPLAGAVPAPQPPEFRDFEHLIAVLVASSNDLEPPALRRCPPIGDVLANLRRLPGARLVRMSGSGPTCFALFATLVEADASERLLGRSRPAWWVAVAELR